MRTNTIKPNSYKPYRGYIPYLFIIPALVYFLVFTFYPIFFTIYISFTKWNLMSNPIFIGIENYIKIFSDPIFLTSLRNSLILAFILQPIITSVGFLLALLLNKLSLWLRNILLFLFILPFIVPMAVSAVIWGRGFYDPIYGFLNALLRAMGLGGIAWLGDPNIALFSISLVNFWAWVGYHSLIYLAGLQSIPQELIEAAIVDGAGSTRIVIEIIIPLLKPVFTAAIILATIGGLQIFTEVYMLTRGGPGYSTYTLGYTVYYKAFTHYDYGMAAAEALVLSLIVFILALIEMKVLGGGR
jgi:ABC-type sugar transport system permease subunit